MGTENIKSQKKSHIESKENNTSTLGLKVYTIIISKKK